MPGEPGMTLAAFTLVVGVTACYCFCITASAYRPFASWIVIGQIAVPYVGAGCPRQDGAGCP
jgi:hypothetical protein